MTPNIIDVAQCSPFAWQWPEGPPEQFANAWEGTVNVNGRLIKFRHGLGNRPVYGRPRVHSVTWLAGQPTVEGVEADDYSQSQSLLSILRASDKSMLRNITQVPDDYRSFNIVNHRDEIVASYSRNGMAAKILEDDIAAWVSHALIRAASHGWLGFQTQSPSPSVAVKVISKSETVTSGTVSEIDARPIVKALLEYGRSVVPLSEAAIPPSFTSDPLANNLVIQDPFAFLLAVIADQGIVAERAWRLPYELQTRLGHLDPDRLSSSLAEVRAAILGPPALHRFVMNVPLWLCSAAERVKQVWGGNAARIWNDEPTAELLQQRLLTFLGIGQKKAAMAVEILARDLRVPIRELGGSDIAYDVHVRRVFLRTGLADRDDLDHMVAIARRLHPERPGELDNPAWLIGRQWCHAGKPNCDECVLREVCPRLIDRAALVKGV